jgi:hypothetical protein
LAGSTRTAAQKAAAADPAAKVTFFRIKNSWGDQGNAGYNDLYIACLDGAARVCTSKTACTSTPTVDHVVLPPGY